MGKDAIENIPLSLVEFVNPEKIVPKICMIRMHIPADADR